MSATASNRVLDILSEYYLAQPKHRKIDCQECFNYVISHPQCPMSVKHDRKLKEKIRKSIFITINEKNRERT